MLTLRKSIRNVVFWGGALCVGLTAAFFAFACDFAYRGFLTLQSYTEWAALLITPLGLGLSAWMTRRFFPGASGSGIPQTIAAINRREDAFRARMLSLPIAAAKISLTFLGILSGASIGREGPTVQVGASLMYAIGRRFSITRTQIRHDAMIVAGGAAGVAAAFNTPLAGIVFAIEELSRSYEHRTSGLTLTAVVVSGITAIAVLGNYTYFGTTNVSLGDITNWVPIAVCGAVGGILGGIFARLLVVTSRELPGPIGKYRQTRPVGFAAACGILIAILGLIADGSTYGTGYEQAKGLVQSTTLVPDTFVVCKFVATALSYVSGIPGGIFAPSLAIGAGVGSDIAAFLSVPASSALVILGMVGYFTGVVQAPLTAAVIVLEMTNDKSMVLPIIATALVARFASGLVCPRPIYRELADNLLAEERGTGMR